VPNPTFSLCHTTARVPDGWIAAAQAWFVACDHPENVEYILVHDEGTEIVGANPGFGSFAVHVNGKRKTAVDGWNCSAEHSTGRFIITVADDWFPCEHWDAELLKVIPDLDGQHVVEVATGGDDGLLTFSLLTRAYYERFNYLFHPDYIGMYADNEFTDVARENGVVIHARHLFFEHKHPLYGTGEDDAVYQRQHRPEAWETGEKVYLQRRAARRLRKCRLFIATPCFGGQVHAAYLASILATQERLLRSGVDVTISPLPGDSLVPRARGVLTAKFMASDCTHMLFVDADLWWKPESVLRLLEATTYPDLPIACGIYPRKEIPARFPVNFAIDEERMLTWHDETQYVEVRDAPTGFLMIRRDAIQQLMDAHPERKCSFREKRPRSRRALRIRPVPDAD
jgi:hypothetical protein